MCNFAAVIQFFMNYKPIFYRLKNLLVSPSDEWRKIGGESVPGISVVHQYALPLIALCSIAAFFGTAIYLDGFNLEESLKKSLIVFTSLFASIYLSVGLIYFLMPRFNLLQDRNSLFVFVSYASSLIFAVKFITELFPELFFLKILNLYTAYIVWEGVSPMFKIDEAHKPGFVGYGALVIIAGNYLVSRFLLFLLPGV